MSFRPMIGRGINRPRRATVAPVFFCPSPARLWLLTNRHDRALRHAMKCPLAFPLLALGPALVAASAHDAAALRARQATTSPAASASSAATATSGAASGASSGTAIIGSSGTGSAYPSTLTFSLISSNPTAIPLSDIKTGTVQNQSTIALSTTYQAGATQTWVPNAPPLPTGAYTLNPRAHDVI